jgi:hypothetical protein
MKATLKIFFTTLLLALPAMAADQEMSYPEEGPLITVVVPDGWISAYEDGELHAAASEKLDTLLTVKTLEATKKEGTAAIAEIKAPLDEAFGEGITHGELQEGGAENLGFYLINSKAKSTTDEGEQTSFINSVMVVLPDSEQVLLVQIMSSEEGSEKHGEAIDKILKSIKKNG